MPILLMPGEATEECEPAPLRSTVLRILYFSILILLLFLIFGPARSASLEHGNETPLPEWSKALSK